MAEVKSLAQGQAESNLLLVNTGSFPEECLQ